MEVLSVDNKIMTVNGKLAKAPSATGTGDMKKSVYDPTGIVEAAGGIPDYVANRAPAYGPFSGASASAAGAMGLVPSPKKGQQNRYLKGDGTWADVLPQVAASDNGKFLRVVSGAWAAVSLSDAHGGNF